MPATCSRRRATRSCCRRATSRPTPRTGTTSTRRSTSIRLGREPGSGPPPRWRGWSGARTSPRCRARSASSRTARSPPSSSARRSTTGSRPWRYRRRRAALAGVKRRLPFRLQLPMVLERGSRLDSGYGETPVRVYRLGGKPTVRLTYRTGFNEYWGIQESDWDEAPVLSDKSLTQRVGGRSFDLYYTGSHLHMVVLRSGGATYWVVNTLLDSLSNETMLAIARGLTPLHK